MAYPVALGQRPLEDREAYEALAQYATDYGRAPLLLMMHAAVPETLRADLLNMIRVNFMAAQGADTSLEADVLFSPLTTGLGGGYYRIDPQVRWHCLVLLRSLYRGDQRPRIRRIAELLWRYVEAREHQANRAADPQLAEFLDIQRWVALAFLEPDCAVHAFADALRQVGDTRSSVALRLGGLTSAIEIPLAGQPELLAYARGMDALVGGNEDEARHILHTLGEGEIRVGSVILKSPRALLEDFHPPAIGMDESKPQATQQRTCFVIMGFGLKTDHTTGHVLDLDHSYAMIQDVVDAAGMKCVRADEVVGNDMAHATYSQIVSSDLVICYLTTLHVSTYYLSGVCLALRPTGTWLIAEKELPEDFSAAVPRLDAMYSQTVSSITTNDRQAFASSLRTVIEGHFSADPDQTAPFIGRLDSPLYTSGRLLPPEILVDKPSDTFGNTSVPSFENVCFVIQGFGIKTEPSSGRMIDLDASYAVIRKAIIGAGLSPMRADEVEKRGRIDTHLRSMLIDAPFVIADLSAATPDVLMQLGIRHGLRPRQTLLIVDEQVKVKVPLELSSLRILRYKHLGEDLGSREAVRLQDELTEWIKSTMGSPAVDSPVYLALQTLRPPRYVQAEEPFTSESPLPHPQVYISCVPDYYHYASALAKALRAENIEIKGEMDLNLANATTSELIALLDNADVVVALAGSNIRDRDMYLDEIDRAEALNKRLIPVFVDATREPSVLLGLTCANRDALGNIMYLGSLKDGDLKAVIAQTARNIADDLHAVRVLEVPAEDAPTVKAQVPEVDHLIPVSMEWARLEITGDSSSLRFIYLTEKVRSEETLATGQLSLADSFIELASQDTNPNGEAAKTLFELLLPVQLREGSLLQVNMVLIVDHQSARYPWELLENRWGIDARPLSVKAGMIRQLKVNHFRTRPTDTYDNTALVIGNPDLSKSQDFADLPGARDEALSVVGTLANAGYEVTDRIGETTPAILEALHHEKWRILHLAGHGVYNYKSAKMSVARSGMVIGPDTILTPGDINQMRWVPELVFINCPHLGRFDGHGKPEPGALAANLAEQFINMGVKAVIAAGWAVDDSASRVFAESFYRHMLVGDFFGEAVRAAREEIYYRYPNVNTWGAYQCYGEPDYRLYDGG